MSPLNAPHSCPRPLEAMNAAGAGRPLGSLPAGFSAAIAERQTPRSQGGRIIAEDGARAVTDAT
jgi:hypothetical protein